MTTLLEFLTENLENFAPELRKIKKKHPDLSNKSSFFLKNSFLTHKTAALTFLPKLFSQKCDIFFVQSPDKLIKVEFLFSFYISSETLNNSQNSPTKRHIKTEFCSKCSSWRPVSSFDITPKSSCQTSKKLRWTSGETK